MEVELDDVFTGKASRRKEGDGEAAVDDAACIFELDQLHQAITAQRAITTQRTTDRQRARTAEPKDRKRGRVGARCASDDRVHRRRLAPPSASRSHRLG